MRTNDKWFEARFRFKEEDGYRELFDADEAVEFVMSFMAKSQRKEHDWNCAVRVYEKVYGVPFPLQMGETKEQAQTRNELEEARAEIARLRAEREGEPKATDSDNDREGLCDYVKPNGELCKNKATYPNGRCGHHKDS